MLIHHTRALDEKAAIQRKREEEAAAKLAAKKSGARIPERPSAPEIARTDSNERPASGPPRIALAGNKPSWREREAQRLGSGSPAAPAAAPPAAPPSDIATSEAQLPKKTGYVPPALRGEGGNPRGRTAGESTAAPRDDSTDTTAKWRPSAQRNGSGRDGSPADGIGLRNMSALRRDGASGLRDQSPADMPARNESPADGAVPAKPAPGKYVPVHLRNRG